MIINITKGNAMVLVLVMDGMRKNISVNTRENHGARKGFKMMKVYRKIIKILEDQLIDNQNALDNSVLDYEFTEEQAEMAKEFISTYMGLLEDQAGNEGEEIEKNPWYPHLRNCVYAFLIAEKEEAAV